MNFWQSSEEAGQGFMNPEHLVPDQGDDPHAL